MARSRDREAFAASAGSKTEPSFALNDEQWLLIADLFPEPEPSPEGGRPPAASRACLKVSAGCCRPARVGKICPCRFLLRALVGVACAIGRAAELGSRLGRVCCAGSIAKARSTRAKPWPMARSARQKKGRMRGQDQARQRHQDPGAHRRGRSALGRAHHQCQSSRSNFDRAAAGAASASPPAGASSVRLGRR